MICVWEPWSVPVPGSPPIYALDADTCGDVHIRLCLQARTHMYKRSSVSARPDLSAEYGSLP